jgi:hypothetical protein
VAVVGPGNCYNGELEKAFIIQDVTHMQTAAALRLTSVAVILPNALHAFSIRLQLITFSIKQTAVNEK